MNLSELTTGEIISYILTILSLILAPFIGLLFKKYVEHKLPDSKGMKILLLKIYLIVVPILLCIYSIYNFDLSTFRIVFTIFSFCILFFDILFLMLLKMSRTSLELTKGVHENVKQQGYISKEIIKNITKHAESSLVTAENVGTLAEMLLTIAENNTDISKSTIKKIEKFKTELLIEINNKKDRKKKG